MRQKSLPSWEYLNECFNYDPDSGVLSWKHRPREHFKDDRMFKSWNVRISGKIVNTITHYGYILVSVDGSRYPAHRIIFKLMTRKDPSMFIDHVNTVKADNRWLNLREASQSENERNRPADKDNVSGYKGVTYHRTKNKYVARIAVNGVCHYLGIYASAEEASRVRNEAALLFHGDFAYIPDN